MPRVNCAASDCAFNHDGCNAFAVTMGTKGCNTFIALDEKGGLPTLKAQVGACQLSECTFNDHLVCHADSVKVDSDEKCLTYRAA